MSKITKFLKKVEELLRPEEKFLKTPVGIFLLGAFLGELAPDPTDAIHFWLERSVFTNLNYSPSFITFLQIYDWYFLTATYFLILLVFAYLLHINNVSTVRRITLIGGVLSIGAVIGILYRFVL